MDSRGQEQRVVGWKLICPRALRSFYKRLGTESRMSLGKNSHMITKRNNFISAWKPYPCANRSVLGKSSAHRRGKVDYFVQQRPFQVKQACWVAVWIVVWPPQLLKTYTKIKKIHMKKIIVDLCDRRQPLDWGCSSMTIVTKHLSTLELCSPGPQEDNFYIPAWNLFCQSIVSWALGVSSLTRRATVQGPWMNKKVKAKPFWKSGGGAKSPELGSETKSLSRQRLPRGKDGQTYLLWDISKMMHSLWAIGHELPSIIQRINRSLNRVQFE